ncbi:hypothetical protein Ae263Ps1_4100 [Pseudonocardia sp. Ae263_Ps1]|nr:hypothetical protein Ae263Ps1_4100 [Pseudonocardia sp. Ae263_Ps1]OLL92924.1 hypothetical protein Ae356Ps1_2821c [Pseudonocardia sp. Ae356_Ps1]
MAMKSAESAFDLRRRRWSAGLDSLLTVPRRMEIRHLLLELVFELVDRHGRGSRQRVAKALRGPADPPGRAEKVKVGHGDRVSLGGDDSQPLVKDVVRRRRRCAPLDQQQHHRQIVRRSVGHLRTSDGGCPACQQWTAVLGHRSLLVDAGGELKDPVCTCATTRA